jgi:hypothetical protein
LKRLLLIVALTLAAVVAAAATPAPASAATPCWKKVVNDWLKDGRIDQIYEDVCYAEALDNLPTDLEEYSSLGDDIRLARTAAQSGRLPTIQRGEGAPGNDRGGSTPVVGGGDDGEGGGGGGDARGDGAVRKLLVKIGPSNAEDVPIPLLILGGIATLLMASGAAGMVARRTAHRRLS